MTNQLQKQTDVTSLAIDNKFINQLSAQIKQKEECGLSFPAGYNYTNALNGAYLTLLDTKDRSGKPVLETCSKSSIAKSFMDLVTLGLDMQKKQAYFVAYGKDLQLMVSTFGKRAIARRYGAKQFNTQVIYEGDSFSYEIVNGKKCNVKHSQDFMNVDNTKIVGAYAIVVFDSGEEYVEVMNFNQIKQAWKQGFGYKEGGSGVHQKFTDQMCMKTVLNRAVKFINNTYTSENVQDTLNEISEVEEKDQVVESVKGEVEGNACKKVFVEAETVEDADFTEVHENGNEVKDESKEEVPVPDFA